METRYIRLEHAEIKNAEVFVVNWCLGNSCNYKCSYCPSGLHDGSKRWPDPETIKNFILRVKNTHPNKMLYFEFTGGEVTLYKHFIKICQFCTEHGVKVGLISNGSRTIRYWEENKQYFDHVCLSYHPEFAEDEHFINVAKILHNDVRTHVNIMMSPEKFDHCFDVANKIKDLGNLSMALQPLIHDFGEVVYDYSDKQHEILNMQHKLINEQIIFTKSFDYYRGAMRAVNSKGESRVSSAHRFISEKANDWSGWHCYAGVEQLIVDMDGRIYRGWCKEGGPIGFIDSPDLFLPSDPVMCTKKMCHCNFDIMCTKESTTK
jgi:MoaA/NifB/PqqE/SkfB family radical SAM enzyme